MTTASGLQIIDSTVGTGASPKPGQICVMHYTGWLYENGQKGKKFDSSVDRNEPFEFPIGQRRVIAGWDEGVATMKVGGKRTLIIPPALGYGARGAGGAIPPNATLMFDVELLGREVVERSARHRLRRPPPQPSPASGRGGSPRALTERWHLTTTIVSQSGLSTPALPLPLPLAGEGRGGGAAAGA